MTSRHKLARNTTSGYNTSMIFQTCQYTMAVVGCCFETSINFQSFIHMVHSVDFAHWWIRNSQFKCAVLLNSQSYAFTKSCHRRAICERIIIGLDRRPETKQGIEGKLIGSDREGLGLGLGIDRQSEPDRRSEPNTVLCELCRQ